MVIQNYYFVATDELVNEENKINNFSLIVQHFFLNFSTIMLASSMFLQLDLQI